MKTFQQSFCERRRCPLDRFMDRVFWRTLPPHATVLAPIIALISKDGFREDYRLIVDCGQARSVGEVRSEIEGYFQDAFFWSQLRKWGIRISTAKLLKLAKECLPEAE